MVPQFYPPATFFCARSHSPTVVGMSAVVLAVLGSAQSVLSDSQVPNIGGGVYNTDYQGYYQ